MALLESGAQLKRRPISVRVATKTTRAKRNARQLINCWRDSLLARDAAVRRRRRRPRMRGPNVRDLRRASGASCLFARARALARSKVAPRIGCENCTPQKNVRFAPFARPLQVRAQPASSLRPTGPLLNERVGKQHALRPPAPHLSRARPLQTSGRTGGPRRVARPRADSRAATNDDHDNAALSRCDSRVCPIIFA